MWQDDNHYLYYLHCVYLGKEEVTVDVSYSKFCIRGSNVSMLLYESFWVKKCHLNIYARYRPFPAAGILLYMGGCNWRPYNMYVVSDCTNNKESYMSDNGTNERCPLGLKMLHILFTITGQNKDSN